MLYLLYYFLGSFGLYLTYHKWVVVFLELGILSASKYAQGIRIDRNGMDFRREKF